MTATDHVISRRRMLRGTAATAAVAAAGASALAACADDPYDGTTVLARRVGTVPLDPQDPAWDSAAELVVALGPQNMALPQKLDPTVSALSVRAVHDGRRIGFLLTWDDAEVNDLTIRVDDFRDACAVLLLPGAPDPALRSMGSQTAPATLLHWKADWQRDVDQGRQGLDAAYPNRSIDVYPPLWNVAPADVDIDAYEAAGALEWLPGVDVGNPMSAATRTSPVEKAIAYGFSTTTTAGTQDATGRGVRSATGWRVVITKPLSASDDGETAIKPLGAFSCAFAVWSGSEGDAGSRKAPSIDVHTLQVAG